MASEIDNYLVKATEEEKVELFTQMNLLKLLDAFDDETNFIGED